MFLTVKQASEKWDISDRRIRVLCSEGKIPGAYQEGRGWKIPADAKKPADGRYKSKESLLAQIDRKKVELDGRRPLTAGEVARLNEEFIHHVQKNASCREEGHSKRRNDQTFAGIQARSACGGRR